MSKVLANRPQIPREEAQENSIAVNDESRFYDLMHATPVMINGVLMPFPIYSEKVQANSTLLDTSTKMIEPKNHELKAKESLRRPSTTAELSLPTALTYRRPSLESNFFQPNQSHQNDFLQSAQQEQKPLFFQEN